MDYKKLIELSKKAAMEWHGTHEYYQAATLITALCEATETLLAEREAAVDEMHGRCIKCKHFSVGILDYPCTDCRYECGANDHWKWRGPTPPDRQKEDNHD